MSITDELREYALGWDERNRVRRDLEHIADRIDAALEERYIELPKDARGQTIRIDEKLRYGANFMRTVEAVNERAFVAWNPEDRCYALYPAENFTHVQPDSWERIIEDACDMTARCCDDDAGKAELVERCKRLAREVG